MSSFDDITGEMLVVTRDVDNLKAFETGSFRRDLLDALDAALRDVETRPSLGDMRRLSVQQLISSVPDLVPSPVSCSPSADDEERQEEMDRILAEAIRHMDALNGRKDFIEENAAAPPFPHTEKKMLDSHQRWWRKRRLSMSLVHPSNPTRSQGPKKALGRVTSPTLAPPKVPLSKVGRPYLFQARALYDRKSSLQAPDKLAFSKGQILYIIRADEGLWRALDSFGNEGDVLPTYLEPQVLAKATLGDDLLVRVIGIDGVWWTVQMVDATISRCHQSLLSLDIDASLPYRRAVCSSYIPGAELAQHLSLIAGQVILTDDCEGDWALARLEQNAGTLRTGLFPTRILFPSSPASDVP